MSAASPSRAVRVAAADLDAFCRAAFRAAGADEPTADAATRAMMHGSRLGVDSHGVRLLDHYLRALQGGRVARAPVVALAGGVGAVASIDAGHAHGALAAFRAMEHAVDLAGRFGVGAVAVRNASHFGPAGAFALAAAEAGMIGLATCNSDSFVRLHGGAVPFHGTNPIACAVPVPGRRPWLLDMATSAVPYNRVLLYRSLGARLPDGVASAAGGVDTDDPDEVRMLAPLGGAFGFKGAGLGGLAEILSAALSGMRLGFEILPMGGEDMSTPREMGAFVLALDPAAFAGRDRFAERMTTYLDALAASPARKGEAVMAPGDREWAEADRRAVAGIPLDPETVAAFRVIAARDKIPLPFSG